MASPAESDEGLLAKAAEDFLAHDSDSGASGPLRTPCASPTPTGETAFPSIAFEEGPGRGKTKRQLEKELAATAERIRRENEAADRRYRDEMRRKAAADKPPAPGPRSSKSNDEITAMDAGDAEYDDVPTDWEDPSSVQAAFSRFKIPPFPVIRLRPMSKKQITRLSGGGAPKDGSREGTPSSSSRDTSRAPSELPKRPASRNSSASPEPSRSDDRRSSSTTRESDKPKERLRVASSSDSDGPASPRPPRDASPTEGSAQPDKEDNSEDKTLEKEQDKTPFLVDTPLDFLIDAAPAKKKKGKEKEKGKELSRQQRDQAEYEARRERDAKMARIDAAKRKARAMPQVSVNQLIKAKSIPQNQTIQRRTDEGTEKCFFCERMYYPEDSGLADGAIYCSSRCVQRIIDKARRVIGNPAAMVSMVEHRTSQFLTREGEAPTLAELDAWIKEKPAFYPVIPEVATATKKTAADKKALPGKEKKKKAPAEAPSGNNQIRLNVRKSLFDKFTTEAEELTELVEVEDIRNMAIGTEEALFYHHKGNVQSKRYKEWFTAFYKALKENRELGRRLLTLDLLPDDLVRMSADQMLGREAEKAPEPATATPVASTDLLGSILGEGAKDTTAQHKSHLFDLNCSICSGKKKAQEKKKEAMDKLEKKLEAERLRREEKDRISAERREQKMWAAQEMKPGTSGAEEATDPAPLAAGGDDDDYAGGGDDDGGGGREEERYDDDNDDDDRGSPALPSSGRFGGKPWQGSVVVGKSSFEASASIVSGDVSRVQRHLPKRLEVVGRIAPKVVLSYLADMRKAAKDFVILCLNCPAQPEHEGPFMRLVEGMLRKERYSVVRESDQNYVKDIYLLPHQPSDLLPDVLLPIHGPGVTKSDVESVLVVIVPGHAVPADPKSVPAVPAKVIKKEKDATEPRKKKSRWGPVPEQEDGLLAKQLQKEIKKEPEPSAPAPVAAAKEYDESRLRDEVINLIEVVKSCTNPSVVSAKVQNFLELSDLKFTPYEETVVLGLLEQKIEKASQSYVKVPTPPPPAEPSIPPSERMEEESGLEGGEGAEERGAAEDPLQQGEELAEGIGTLKSLLEFHVRDGGSIPPSLSPDFVRSLMSKYGGTLPQDDGEEEASLDFPPPPPPPPQEDRGDASQDMDLEEGELSDEESRAAKLQEQFLAAQQYNSTQNNGWDPQPPPGWQQSSAEEWMEDSPLCSSGPRAPLSRPRGPPPMPPPWAFGPRPPFHGAPPQPPPW